MEAIESVNVMESENAIELRNAIEVKGLWAAYEDRMKSRSSSVQTAAENLRC